MAENEKINILIPIAGKAQRFADAGYTMPKPLIKVCGKDIIDRAMDSINCPSFRASSIYESELIKYIFVVRRDHVQKYGIDEVIRKKMGNKKVEIVVAETDTEGALCTCLLAKKHIYEKAPLLIFTPDIEFSPVSLVDVLNFKEDGVIFTFKANSDAHSYAEVVDDKVVKTAEKEVISQNAALGLYYFKDGSKFVDWAQTVVQQEEKTKGEYYICPIYNYFVRYGNTVTIRDVQNAYVLGTPEDVEFYEKHIYPQSKPIQDTVVGLCCDHSGFETKEKMKKMLKNQNIKFVDYGTYMGIPCDYSDYCMEACYGLNNKDCDLVFGFCRTGNGMNICANKYDGVIAALVNDEYTAQHAISHNCANFLSVPEKDMTDEKLKDIMLNGLFRKFEGGRHTTRIRKFLK